MGTPFIITIFVIIFVCIAMAIVVVAFMRANHAFDGEETEYTPPIVPSGNQPTGPFPPFMPLPHQTQPLSEIYYYNEQVPDPQADASPTSSEPINAPAQNTAAEVSPPPMPPPSGPLPGYYPNE